MLHLPSPIPFHDLLFIILHTVVDSSAILINLTLLLAIYSSSPPSLKSYAVLLTNSVLIDFLAATASLMIMIRVIPVHEMMVYVYDGPCAVGFFCHCFFIVSLATFVQSLYLIAISFAFRLYALERQTPRPYTVLLACVLVYIPTLAVLMPYLFSLDDVGDVRRALAVAKPTYEMGQYTLQGHLCIYHWTVIFAVAATTVPSVPALVGVILLRAKVLSKVVEKSGQLSSKTMRMHSALTKVLSLQALLPVFFLVGVVNYFMCQLNIVESTPVQEHFMMQTVSFIPLIAPLITLYYVQPYREFLVSCVGCGKMFKTSTTISSLNVSDLE